jgi:hypothetical protein
MTDQQPDPTLDAALRTHTDYGVEKLEEADC